MNVVKRWAPELDWKLAVNLFALNLTVSAVSNENVLNGDMDNWIFSSKFQLPGTYVTQKFKSIQLQQTSWCDAFGKLEDLMKRCQLALVSERESLWWIKQLQAVDTVGRTSSFIPSFATGLLCDYIVNEKSLCTTCLFSCAFRGKKTQWDKGLIHILNLL